MMHDQASREDSDAMMSTSPIVVVIGGPNGTGKSTVAPTIIERAMREDMIVHDSSAWREMERFS